jgi:hypothetical protein
MFEQIINHYSKYPLDLITESSTLLPIVIALSRYKYLNVPLKLLVYFFLLRFIRDFISNIYALNGKNNLYLYNLSAFIEILFVGYMYNLILKRKTSKKLTLVGLIIAIVLNIFLWTSDEFSASILTSARIYTILVSLLYFNELLNELNVKNILIYSLFWITSGFILQATGTVFILLFAHLVLSKNTNPADFDLYWNVNQVMYILFCAISAVGFILSKYDKENYI